MSTNPSPRPEERPTDAVAADPAPRSTHSDAPYVPDPESPIPLLRLRRGGRAVIPPESCKVKACPICQWRREGLIPPAGAARTYLRP